MKMPGYLRTQPDGVLLSVKVQPRASANQIGEPLGDELRIKVTAPPVDAAANEALVDLLARRLGCGKGRIELIRGQTSRHKLIKLHGFTAEEVLGKLPPAGDARPGSA
jgi:hypothetical protein